MDWFLLFVYIHTYILRDSIEVSLFTFNTSLGMAYRRVCDDLTAQARLLLPRDSAKHE